MDIFKPSKQALFMLADMERMNENDTEWLRDMTFGIASILHDITAKIENPPNQKKTKGCEIIHLGAELFLPIRDLKQKLEHGLNLDDYVRGLDAIICKLEEIVDKNYEVLYKPKVRNHMKQITNAIVVNLEAGAVINFLLQTLGSG